MGIENDVDIRLFPKRGPISKIIIASGIFFWALLTPAFAIAFFQSLLGLF